MKFLTSGPDELIAKEPLGTPVRYVFSEACYKFKFSREQLHSIYDQINREATIKVSHQIALVAHMWTAINRARNFGESDCANFTTLISMRSKLPEGDYSNYAGSFVGGGQVCWYWYIQRCCLCSSNHTDVEKVYQRHFSLHLA